MRGEKRRIFRKILPAGDLRVGGEPRRQGNRAWAVDGLHAAPRRLLEVSQIKSFGGNSGDVHGKKQKEWVDAHGFPFRVVDDGKECVPNGLERLGEDNLAFLP